MTTAEATGDQIAVDDDEPVEQAELLDHTYDGIREYDNPLPSWWRISFIGTIVFAGFYALYFHVVDWGSTPDDNYRATLAAYDDQRGAREAAEIASIDERALAQKASSGAVARGAEVFATRCASCHGPAGAGLIGPNLTDEMQKHGMTRMDLYMTVRRGVPGTAMVSWAEQLPAPDLVAVTAFVISLRGTNVPGKPPEGAPVGAFAP